jgi:DNA-binding CsgD family transcriptional regulator
MSYDRLTGREKEVLQQIAGGKTSKQVAEALSVSIHTISNHRKHICRKLGLHSTAELVAFAARQVPPQEKAEAAGS